MQRSLSSLLAAGLVVVFVAGDGADAPGVDGRTFGEWIALFNGRDTSGWTKAKRDQESHTWKVADGTLTNAGDTGMDVCTEEEFSNYELELEYKLPSRGGNSGVFLRGQIEIQIDSAFGEKALSKRRMGAVFDLFPPAANPQKPAGEWNHLRVLHVGLRISVWHNGILIQDQVFVDEHTASSMMESVQRDRRGLPLDLFKGPIMLQGDHSVVWYRNLRIREVRTGVQGQDPSKS